MADVKENQEYAVWSNEHSAWWGPNKAGYYSTLADAGRYTREQAIKICIGARGGRLFNENPSEVPLLLTDAEAFWPDETSEQRREKWQRRMREAEREASLYD
jgi:hypothetical protein